MGAHLDDLGPMLEILSAEAEIPSQPAQEGLPPDRHQRHSCLTKLATIPLRFLDVEKSLPAVVHG
jgi:hypothetical protein